MFCVNIIALMVCLSYSITSAALTKRSPDDLPIKYPGPTKDIDVSRYGRPGDDQVPEECRGQNYCHVKPRDYPQKTFEKIFENLTNILQQPELVTEMIVNRQGDIEDKDDCKSEVTYKTIYQIYDPNGEAKNKWRNVVNLENKSLHQKIRIETCKEAGASCFKEVPMIPGITTKCKQKYSIWKLPVEKDDKTIEYIDTDLPVCCSCNYKVVDIEDRFGDKAKPKN